MQNKMVPREGKITPTSLTVVLNTRTKDRIRWESRPKMSDVEMQILIAMYSLSNSSTIKLSFSLQYVEIISTLCFFLIL